MIKSPLYHYHTKLGAKMVDFGGYEMPLYYSGIAEEHQKVRSHVGIFDVSHMGQIIISGLKANQFLQRILVSNIHSLQAGQSQYSLICNENGGIIDDLLVYRFPEIYMLVVNASNLEKNLNWLQKQNKENICIKNKSNEISLIALQGPSSRLLISDLFGSCVESLSFCHFVQTTKYGSSLTISRTGYTGELGYELYCTLENVEACWEELAEKGVKYGLVYAGLGARDLLRMEMKYCLYGNDIDENTTPFEAGLRWVVDLDKEDFIGKSVLSKFLKNGTKQLVCFQLEEKAIPRKGYPICVEGHPIGMVTSGGFSSVLNRGIGMGFVKREYKKSGHKIEIDIRGKLKSAVVKKPPLYTKGTLYS